jgi:hypothetical protein
VDCPDGTQTLNVQRSSIPDSTLSVKTYLT